MVGGIGLLCDGWLELPVEVALWHVIGLRINALGCQDSEVVREGRSLIRTTVDLAVEIHRRIGRTSMPSRVREVPHEVIAD